MDQQPQTPPNWRRIILAFAQKYGKTDIVSNVALAALLNHPQGAALIVEFLASTGVTADPVEIQHDAVLYMSGPAKHLYTSGKNYRFADNVEVALRDTETEGNMSLIKLLRRLITKSNIVASIWRNMRLNTEPLSLFLDQKITTPMVGQTSPAPTSTPASTPAPTPAAPSRPNLMSVEKKPMHPNDILTALSDAAPGQYHVAAAISELLSLQSADLLPGPSIAPSIMLLGAPDSGQTQLVRTLAGIYCPDKQAAGTEAKAKNPEANILTIDGASYNLDHHVAGLCGAPGEYRGSENGGIIPNFLAKPGPKIVYIVNLDLAHTNVQNFINGVIRGETTQDKNGKKFNAGEAIFVFSVTAINEEAAAQPTPRERDQCLYRLVRRDLGDVLVDAMHRVCVLKPLQGGAAFALIKAQMARFAENLAKRQVTLVVDAPVIKHLAQEFSSGRKADEEITPTQVEGFLTEIFALPIALRMQAGDILPGQTITPSFTRDGLVLDAPTNATAETIARIRAANAGSPQRKTSTPPPGHKPPQKEREA